MMDELDYTTIDGVKYRLNEQTGEMEKIEEEPKDTHTIENEVSIVRNRVEWKHFETLDAQDKQSYLQNTRTIQPVRSTKIMGITFNVYNSGNDSYIITGDDPTQLFKTLYIPNTKNVSVYDTDKPV